MTGKEKTNKQMNLTELMSGISYIHPWVALELGLFIYRMYLVFVLPVYFAIQPSLIFCTIEGFHVTSYQAHFASHLTGGRHVGFHSLHSGVGKYNQMPQNFLFSLYHKTKLQLSDKNISTHTQVKFKILLWSESKIIAYFVVFLHTALYKRKPRSGA